MNIINIVNRDIVNLTNCEHEPIHIPGSIQPHGFLLGLKNDSLHIEFCSANSAEFIKLPPETLLGKELTALLSQEAADSFRSYINTEAFDSSRPFVFSLDDVSYNTTVHPSGNHLILEIEPFPDGSLNLPDLYSQTRKFVSYMEKITYLGELCQNIADQTRQITGYDRVMIYKFDPDYNGEVIAESKREDLNSFSGQKYPHTDIPVQARELYMRNPLRMIADINYTPVPLLALDETGDKSNKSLDLSLSILRSVSPIHVEYMKNMGVGATLTISLLQNQKLWGLIACHHYSPKILPHYTRLSALLHGHFLTSQIAVRETAEEFEVSQEVEKSLGESLTLLHEHEDFIEACHQSPSLLKLANASGSVIFYQGNLYKNGEAPEDDELLPLFHFLHENYSAVGLVTNELTSVYTVDSDISKFAAGIIYHSLALGSQDGIIWLRKELPETINWAGDPNKAVIENKDGFRLSPRKSFELWMEEVKGKSEHWRKTEINAANTFSYSLQKHINFGVILHQENKNRILNDELRVANKELANLNWISTHDLKEPLRKIQIFASKVLDREDPDLSVMVKDSVERMRFAAEKMQTLIEDILAYSKTGNMEKVFKTLDLNIILTNVLEELSTNIDENNALVHASSLPTLSIIPFQVHQLFVNLLTNAVKFTREGVTPVINIDAVIVSGKEVPGLTGDNQYHKISFSDNGIGFEEEYRSRIFGVFQRLHPSHKYPGTGIGLAICRKIMENHRGAITADSVPEQGATFTLYFPAE